MYGVVGADASGARRTPHEPGCRHGTEAGAEVEPGGGGVRGLLADLQPRAPCRGETLEPLGQERAGQALPRVLVLDAHRLDESDPGDGVGPEDGGPSHLVTQHDREVQVATVE